MLCLRKALCSVSDAGVAEKGWIFPFLVVRRAESGQGWGRNDLRCMCCRKKVGNSFLYTDGGEQEQKSTICRPRAGRRGFGVDYAAGGRKHKTVRLNANEGEEAKSGSETVQLVFAAKSSAACSAGHIQSDEKRCWGCMKWIAGVRLATGLEQICE